MSPLAQGAILKALEDLSRYPDGNGFELKQALERRFRVPADRIVLGNGSNDVLDLAARAFLTPGDEAIYSACVRRVSSRGPGDRARGIEVPARDYGHDIEAMARA